jgi:hypothetical protein
MNGEFIRTDNGISRKDFIRYLTLMAGSAFTGLQADGCRPAQDPYAHIKGGIIGASAAVGHQLRQGAFAAPAVVSHCPVVIAGGGVAGLSAARALQQQGIKDFQLLELEAQAGGNSSSGHNCYTSYPWGAHYLPIPNHHDTPLLRLLQEAGIITGYTAAGLPVYNETDLCFDPQERLYINGRWQEGLVPQFGLAAADNKAISDFLQLMESWRTKKGSDGRYAFDIPMALSSADEAFLSLDGITMAAYLQQEGFSSTPLLWYVDYCCRDDYGAGIRQVSAWAGIHYFASRRGQSGNVDSRTVLTWPEGNGRLVKHLQQYCREQLQPQSLVYRVTPQPQEVWIDYLDVRSHTTKRIIAERCIMATPHFITQRLLGNHAAAGGFAYSPWMVANITLDGFPDSRGSPLSWDNVCYKGRSLGYVYAQQQLLQREAPQAHVITYYLPLDQLPPADARKYAIGLQHAHWVRLITDELEKAHSGIRRQIQQIDVWVWGHGMIRPEPGFISGEGRLKAQQALDGKVFFAHSDLSGISIFEEAFYHGNRAAMAVVRSLTA